MAAAPGNDSLTTHPGMDPPAEGFTSIGIVKAISVALLIIVAVAGNLVVCISFTLFRNLRSITNYFLVSLSISDILVAIIVMPIFMLMLLYSPRPFFSLDQIRILEAWQIMDFFLCLASIWTLTAIAVERNLAISQPFYYTKWVSHARVYIVMALLWSLSLSVSVITFVDPFEQKSHLSLLIVIASYFLPLFLILITYAQIWLVARRQTRRLRQDGALGTDLKAVKTIAIVIGTFFVCYTPNMIVILLYHFELEPLPTLTTVAIAKWLVYFNSCANPIIYSCFNRTYRTGFKRLFQTIVKKSQEFRRRVCGKRQRKLQQSRLSLNATMRSSAGSLLDGPKPTTANSQQHSNSVHSNNSDLLASHGVANAVQDNEQISCKQLEDVISEPAEVMLQDTQH